jgi:hypothetical protein
MYACWTFLNVAVASAIEETPVDGEGCDGEGVSPHAEEDMEDFRRGVGSEVTRKCDSGWMERNVRKWHIRCV